VSGRAELRLGTRASRLARRQTRAVAEALRSAYPGLDCVEVTIRTAGDRDRRTPLPEIGGKGVFTEALEAALLAGEIDIAVHSLKDLPVAPPPRLVIAAVCFRADPRDVLVSRDGWLLDSLPQRALVGTSSTRRIAQLRSIRPDLRLESLRGNVDTRVRQARGGRYDAICIAAAGVERLGLAETVSEYLALDRMLPAPGQGALAVQCAAANRAARDLVAVLDDASTRAAVDAERAFLAGLGGGCAAPVAAFAAPEDGNGSLRLRGLAAAVDGTRVVRVAGTGAFTAPVELGRRMAAAALTQGAGAFVG